MQTIANIELNTIDDVKNFITIANEYDGQITVRSGGYAVDGKSIMGIFSLDLSKQLTVEFSDTPIKEYLSKFSSWIVN